MPVLFCLPFKIQMWLSPQTAEIAKVHDPLSARQSNGFKTFAHIKACIAQTSKSFQWIWVAGLNNEF